MTWRHYCYGLRYLGRSHLRDLLKRAEAARIGGATQDSYQTAVRDLRRLVEVPRE